MLLRKTIMIPIKITTPCNGVLWSDWKENRMDYVYLQPQDAEYVAHLPVGCIHVRLSDGKEYVIHHGATDCK